MTSSIRRRRLIGAAGVIATLGGATVALRRPGKPAAAPVSAPAQAFWDAHFERPEGGELAAASLRGKPLVLNFWATWCAPCVKELPELSQFQREQRGWQVVGVAVDAVAPVREFLRKLPLDFPVGMAGLSGMELTRTLGNPQGGLPFSVAFNAQGELIWHKLGPTSLEELHRLAAAQA